MDDKMLELTAGNQTLRRRLDAYADARLSPDAAAATRMRARVMAAAHRQAATTAAGAGLTVMTVARPPHARRRPQRLRRRAAGVLLSAALGLSVAVGSAMAADPGGVLYPALLGLETLLLPGDSSERAVAQLERLETRLVEAHEASSRGDAVGVAAAMGAYAAIVDAATASALLANDPVATAALEAGMARNLQVLHALLATAPDAAIGGLARAIERSAAAMNDMNRDNAGGGSGGSGANGGAGGRGADPGPAATRAPKPTKTPTGEPTSTKEPRPTKEATVEPTAEPTAQSTPEPTAEPTAEPTPRPARTPPGKTTPGPSPDRSGETTDGDAGDD